MDKKPGYKAKVYSSSELKQLPYSIYFWILWVALLFSVTGSFDLYHRLQCMPWQIPIYFRPVLCVHWWWGQSVCEPLERASNWVLGHFQAEGAVWPKLFLDFEVAHLLVLMVRRLQQFFFFLRMALLAVPRCCWKWYPKWSHSYWVGGYTCLMRFRIRMWLHTA